MTLQASIIVDTVRVGLIGFLMSLDIKLLLKKKVQKSNRNGGY